MNQGNPNIEQVPAETGFATEYKVPESELASQTKALEEALATLNREEEQAENETVNRGGMSADEHRAEIRTMTEKLLKNLEARRDILSEQIDGLKREEVSAISEKAPRGGMTPEEHKMTQRATESALEEIRKKIEKL